MRNWLLNNLCAAFAGLFIFIVGFLVGTIIDIGFFNLYRKIDPNQENKGKLLALAVVQLFIIIFIIHATQPIKILGPSFSFGLMSSQVFLFVHAIETIANKVFDRDCTV